jgi:hypothetical protein
MTASCEGCRPPVLGPTRTQRDHVAVRFGDNTRGVRVWLNGEDVTARCLEAMRNGDGGWAILKVQPEVVCPNGGDHPHSRLTYGRVQIIHPDPEPST